MRNPNRETVFRFKQFAVVNRLSAMKVGTDGVLLGAWALCTSENPTASNTSPSPRRILDVGCGTGLIALMMAQRFPSADVFAIELDTASADEASANFEASPWADRLHLIQGDFLQAKIKQEFDLIVSNPPFFTNGLVAPDQARHQARHESALPLASLIKRSLPILSPTGKIALVLPADRLQELSAILQNSICSELTLSRVCMVSTVPTKPPRRLLAELDRQALSPSAEQLSIHDGNGCFTQRYINLTKDFYLNF